jgi:hypothetical protein
MRILIPFLCLILCCSCHNKSDLKRIAELERENKEIKEKYNPEHLNSLYQSAKKNIIDSIVFDEDENNVDMCGLGDVLYFQDITATKTIKLNHGRYQSNIRLMYINKETEKRPFDSIYYSTPSKNRNSLVNNNSNTNFIFSSKDTGWFYWNGKILIINPRTGQKTYFPITDSFYVYK